MARPTVEFYEALCKAESDKAVLCVLDDGREFWIPKSQVDDDSEVYSLDDTGTLIITEWWADREGI